MNYFNNFLLKHVFLAGEKETPIGVSHELFYQRFYDIVSVSPHHYVSERLLTPFQRVSCSETSFRSTNRLLRIIRGFEC